MGTLILISFGLAMDCFAVSIAGGAIHKKHSLKNAARVAFSFGLFQAVMPLIGWFAGRAFESLIADYDHWIAFFLLLAVGTRMIYESFDKLPDNTKKDIFKLRTLLILSIATSIDALAVGITLGLLRIPLAVSVFVIGAFAFTLSFIGYYLGRKTKNLLKGKAEIVGGLILIGIGIKILIQHLS